MFRSLSMIKTTLLASSLVCSMALAQQLTTTNNTGLYSSVLITSGLNKGKCAVDLSKDAYTGPQKPVSKTDWIGALGVSTMCLLSHGTSSFPCTADVYAGKTSAECSQGQKVATVTLNSDGTIQISNVQPFGSQTITFTSAPYALNMK